MESSIICAFSFIENISFFFYQIILKEFYFIT
jgi:hypothetical protein